MCKPHLQDQGSVPSFGSLISPLLNTDFFVSWVTHSPGSHVTDVPAEYPKHAPVTRNRIANFEGTRALQISVSAFPQENECLWQRTLPLPNAVWAWEITHHSLPSSEESSHV